MNTQENQGTKSVTQAIAEGNINAALSAANAAPNVPSLTETGKLGREDGLKLAQAAHDADVSVGRAFRDILILRAKQFNGNEEEIRNYLSGFRVAFSEKTADKRASDARAVFMACAKDGGQFVPELEAFSGTYHALITRCRDIKGRTGAGRGAGPGKVSGKGMETIENKVKLLNAGQSAVLLQKAIEQVQQTSPENWELKLLQQIDGICIRLGQSKQPAYREIAALIQDISADILNADAVNHAQNASSHNAQAVAQAAQVPQAAQAAA